MKLGAASSIVAPFLFAFILISNDVGTKIDCLTTLIIVLAIDMHHELRQLAKMHATLKELCELFRQARDSWRAL